MQTLGKLIDRFNSLGEPRLSFRLLEMPWHPMLQWDDFDIILEINIRDGKGRRPLAGLSFLTRRRPQPRDLQLLKEDLLNWRSRLCPLCGGNRDTNGDTERIYQRYICDHTNVKRLLEGELPEIGLLVDLLSHCIEEDIHDGRRA